MYGIFIALHLLICLGLIISVLLQSSKGEGLAGAFGGGGMTGTVFGGRGAATFLQKATTVLAISFFASALLLSFLNPTTGTATGPQGSSAVQEAAGELPPPAPVTQPDAAQPQQQQPPEQVTPIEQFDPAKQNQPAQKPPDTPK